MPRSFLPILFFAFILSACSSLGYYAQAIGGHIEVMQAARPITEVIEDPASDPDLRKKLEEVRLIRDFASRELGLPDNSSYRSYADLRRPFVLWNVFAAPEFSLHSENWCMLIVGCVGYRGYFDRNAAELLASELRQRGFDTYVGGVPAYSTLGYFSDPVLNTFLRAGSLETARVIFHELAHQMLFIKGDTAFNESFAVTVESEGMRRWLASRANPDPGEIVNRRHRQKTSFIELISAYRARLNKLYASDLAVDAKRIAKAEVMQDIKRSYQRMHEIEGNLPIYKQWLEHDLNNAKIASLALYTELVPGFEALLKEEAYNLPRFYRRVAILGSLPYDERYAALKQINPDKAVLATQVKNVWE